MKKIEDFAAYIFILAVAILSLVSIFGVWDFFRKKWQRNPKILQICFKMLQV